MKHTPGPWYLNQEIDEQLYVEHEHGMICDMQLSDDLLNASQILTDARLIAAAPELLDAAKRAFSLIKESGFSSGLIEEEFDATLHALNAAIAKANGEVTP